MLHRTIHGDWLNPFGPYADDADALCIPVHQLKTFTSPYRSGVGGPSLMDLTHRNVVNANGFLSGYDTRYRACFREMQGILLSGGAAVIGSISRDAKRVGSPGVEEVALIGMGCTEDGSQCLYCLGSTRYKSGKCPFCDMGGGWMHGHHVFLDGIAIAQCMEAALKLSESEGFLDVFIHDWDALTIEKRPGALPARHLGGGKRKEDATHFWGLWDYRQDNLKLWNRHKEIRLTVFDPRLPPPADMNARRKYKITKE